MTQYPRDILDTPETLLGLLGSFWTSYDGQDVATSLLGALTALERQTSRDEDRLLAAVSRKTVPVTDKRVGLVWTIRESDTNKGYAGRRFGETGLVFDGDGPVVFGKTGGKATYAWPLPADVTTAAFVANRITHASRTMIRDIDFVIDSGHVVFRDDPFTSADFPVGHVLEGGESVDREILLWLGETEHADHLVSRQFGYALGLDRPSSRRYRDLINALLDAVNGGTTALTVRRVWAAAAGLPLVASDGETVEDVDVNGIFITVITSRQVYALPPGAKPTVKIGQVLHAGDTLDDSLEFFELGDGRVPDAEFLPALCLGEGFVSAGLFGELVFRNEETPLRAWREADGRTKVSFALGGWPADVEKFFDDAHDRGDVSIAEALDVRPLDRRTEPAGPENLPKTVNPLALLCRHFLRDNAVLLRLRPESFPDGLDAEAAKLLRRVTPPQTAIIVIGRLVGSERPVTMDGPGTIDDPGYDEAVTVYDGVSVSETVNALSFVSESVRLININGHCV